MRRYTTHDWILWNGFGWRGCSNFSRFPRRLYL